MLGQKVLYPLLKLFLGATLSYLFRFFCFVFTELVEKKWENLRNRYSRVNRELREKNVSGTGTASLKNAKRKIEELNFLSWIEPFIKPGQSRGTYTSNKKREEGESAFDDTMEAGESRSLLEENDHSNKISGSNSESVSGVKGTNKDVTIGIKRKINCNSVKNVMSTQEQNKPEILDSVGQAAKDSTLSENPLSDEHDIFSKLMAKKMRKLAELLSENEMEDLQGSITDVLCKVKKMQSKTSDDPPVNVTNQLS